MHGGPSLRHGDTNEGLNIPSGIGCGVNDTGRLVTWEFPLRTDFSILKILGIVHTIYFLLQFLYSARKFKIVFLVLDELSSCDRI